MRSDYIHDNLRKVICIPTKVNCSVARKRSINSTEHLLYDFTICLLDTYYRTLMGQIITGLGKENQKCDMKSGLNTVTCQKHQTCSNNLHYFTCIFHKEHLLQKNLIQNYMTEKNNKIYYNIVATTG